MCPLYLMYGFISKHIYSSVEDITRLDHFESLETLTDADLLIVVSTLIGLRGIQTVYEYTDHGLSFTLT